MVSAHDVADELRRRLPDLGTAKLHKLLYYAQGMHLARFGVPLFEEAIQAWPNGPVVAVLWADERHERGRPRPSALAADDVATVGYVAERYGRYTGSELIDKTHQEAPWLDLSESEELVPPHNPVITHDALRSWFGQIERLRASKVYSFEPRPLMPEEEAAVNRALRGERVVHRKPG
jgi:uncharacterized phage-associated protein